MIAAVRFTTAVNRLSTRWSSSFVACLDDRLIEHFSFLRLLSSSGSSGRTQPLGAPTVAAAAAAAAAINLI